MKANEFFIQSEVNEIESARAMLDGDFEKAVRPTFIAAKIPSTYGAMFELTKKYDITIINRRAKKTVWTDELGSYYAIVCVACHGTKRLGAAHGPTSEIAELLAYRNAVRHVLYGTKEFKESKSILSDGVIE